jgi:hypothetical protein
MTALIEILDWERLPEETRMVASYLADGWSQTDIARELAMT